MEKIPGRRKWTLIVAVLCIAAAVISFTVIDTWASSPGFLNPILESLDAKKQDVLELAAASTGASVGISALPGDLATPIAEKMANISQYLMIVMCAIYLEKYIITIMGFVTFKVLVPLACVMFAAGILIGKPAVQKAAARIMVFGVMIFAVIPLSVHISDIISESYKESVNATLEAAEQVAPSESAEAAGETGKADGQTTGQTGNQATGNGTEKEEDKSLWDYLKGLPSTVAETASEAVSGAGDVTQEKVEELQKLLNNFMESVAVMIITSCVIPILVLLFFGYLIKLVFDIRPGM